MKVGERIRQRREALGISAEKLGEMIGKVKTTIYRYENGDIESMPSSLLEPIAKALNTTPAYLMGWTADPEVEHKESEPESLRQFDNIHPISTQKVPMLGEISCGTPIYANEDRESYVLLGTDVRADFCLTAKGDSMVGARINNGDIVFCRQQDMVENGEIAAVIIGDEATLKRVYYYTDKKKFVLQAENPKYAPLVYEGEELDDIHILGKAIAFQSDIE